MVKEDLGTFSNQKFPELTIEDIKKVSDYIFKKEADIILGDDILKRTGYIVRECKLLESDRKGYFLYLSALPERIKEIDELLEDLPIEKLSGKEAKDIIKKTLHLPESYVPMAFFTVGYPLKSIHAPPRKELQEIIYDLNV